MTRPTYAPRLLLEVNAAYDDFLAVGFPVTFEGVAETLQVARDVDRTNWLTLLGICDEAIALGAGDLDIDPPGIRTTSNRNYIVTYAEAATIIRALRAWGLQAWANWGRLKDLVREAESNRDLAAIERELAEGGGWS